MPDEIDDGTPPIEVEPDPVIPESDPPQEIPPRDPETGQFVSREEFTTLQGERDADRERLAQLETENATLRQPPPSAPPATEPEFKFYTPTELSSAVERGIITDDQRQERIQLQTEKRTEAIVRETIRRERTVHEDSSGIEGYLSLMPDLNNQTSENYKRFAEEWRFHTSRGLANSDTTKLIVLRSAFGPLDRLQQAKATSERTPKLAHEGVGSRGDPVPKNGGDPLTKLPQAEKQAYADMVKTGMTSWAEIREELTFAQTQNVNPRLRERALK